MGLEEGEDGSENIGSAARQGEERALVVIGAMASSLRASQ